MFAGPCKILIVGPTVGGQTELKIRPQDGSFPVNFFLSRSNVSREVLATALAAVVSNRLVWCEIPNETTSYSEITRILIGDDQ